MKHVLYIVPDLHGGGAERCSLTLMRMLKQHDFDVTIVNLGSPHGEAESWLDANEHIISLDCKRVLNAFFPLWHLCKQLHADYIFTSRQHTACLVLILSFFCRLRAVIRIPNMPSRRLYSGIQGIKERLMYRIGRFLYPRALSIVAQTEEMKQEMCTLYHLDSNKVFVVPNPVDQERINDLAIQTPSPYTSDEIPFLAVGNTSYAKAHDVLIQAMEHFHANHDNATLHIVGRTEGEWGDKIRTLAQGKDYIHLHGFIPNPYPYIKHCRALVLSSRIEGYPNVVLEAMALQRPVVVTDCLPILKRIVTNDINGQIVPVDDANALAQGMEKILQIATVNNTITNEAITPLLHAFESC
ncbi:MAG: glycosyltransferase [Paludibacteraceae bacterium]|nr:glycosyltransferase [Paludibacteraceae bacterium]